MPDISGYGGEGVKSKSLRSNKPPLDPKRVEVLLQAVDTKFGVYSYNIKIVII